MLNWVIPEHPRPRLRQHGPERRNNPSAILAAYPKDVDFPEWAGITACSWHGPKAAFRRQHPTLQPKARSLRRKRTGTFIADSGSLLGIV